MYDARYSPYKKTLLKTKWLSFLEKLIFKDSINGFVLRCLQQIPVSCRNKATNREALIAAADYLSRKEQIGIFPEGAPQLKKKKIFPGVAILAQKSKCRILPAYIETNSPPNDYNRFNFTKVRINMGKPIKFSKSIEFTKKMVMKEIYKLKND